MLKHSLILLLLQLSVNSIKIPSLSNLFNQKLQKQKLVQATKNSIEKQKQTTPDQNGWLSSFPSGFEQLTEIGENKPVKTEKRVVQPLSFKFDSGRTFIQSTEPPVVFERSLTEDVSKFTKKYQYVNSMLLFLTNYEFSLSRVQEYGCYCLPNAFFENDGEYGVNKVLSTPANGHPLDHLDKSCKKHKLCSMCADKVDDSCDSTNRGYWFQGGIHVLTNSKFIKCLNPENSCERRVCECDRMLASELAGELAAGFNVIYDFQDHNYEMNEKIAGRNETCQKLPKLQTNNYKQEFGATQEGNSRNVIGANSGGGIRVKNSRKRGDSGVQNVNLDTSVSECCVFNEYAQFYHPTIQECCSDGIPKAPGNCPI